MNIFEIMFTKTASLQCTGTLQYLLNESATESKYLFNMSLLIEQLNIKKEEKGDKTSH